MAENSFQNVDIQPIIDSQNPPVSVDSVMLSESSTGAVRLVCFANNTFVEREEHVQKDGIETKRLWVRPVSVIDVGSNAVNFIEAYLLHRLSDNTSDMKYALDSFPEIMDKLYESLKKMKEKHADE